MVNALMRPLMLPAAEEPRRPIMADAREAPRREDLNARAREPPWSKPLHYDPFAEEVIEDPQPVYAKLREEGPCCFIPKYDTYACRASRTSGTRRWTRRATRPRERLDLRAALKKIQPVTPMINNMDPPRHTQMRSKIVPYFTPGGVRKLEPQIARFVADAFAEAKQEKQADLFNGFAAKVSVKVACLANGFPMEDSDMLNGLVWRFFGREEGVEGMTQDGVNAMMEMFGYFGELIAKRRAAGADRETVVDLVCRYEDEQGKKFDVESASSHLSMFLIGGAETFPKTFASTVLRLWQHKDQRAELAKNPALIPEAYREALRYDMPTQFLMREGAAPVKLHDKTMQPGRRSCSSIRRRTATSASSPIPTASTSSATAAHPVLRPRHPPLHRAALREAGGEALHPEAARLGARVRGEGGRAEAPQDGVRAGLGVDAGGVQPLNRAVSALLVVLLAGVSGCAALFHKPRPDLELAVEQRPWRVRCGWVLPPAAEAGGSPSPRAEGWAWASDSAQRRLIVNGRIEDGFFLVEGVRAASDKDDRDVLPYPATARDVEARLRHRARPRGRGRAAAASTPWWSRASARAWTCRWSSPATPRCRAPSRAWSCSATASRTRAT